MLGPVFKQAYVSQIMNLISKFLCVMLFMCTAHAKDDSMLVDQVKFGTIYSKRYKLECEKQTNTFDQSIWLTGESFGSFSFFFFLSTLNKDIY